MNRSSSALATAKSILFSALEIDDAGARACHVREACANDESLFCTVEKLLEAKPAANDDLFARASDQLKPEMTRENMSHWQSASPLAEEFDVNQHPVIGRYKILEEIGRGGMGTVYMAQQTEPIRRRVALKLINPGMDSREVIARFEAERQALAMMDHPNIARVLDAGTTERGRPYFVMELVRGIPITEYCQQHQLPLEEKLRLFVDVCQAVQHAHQKGIIHRDLKPSNVMICNHDGTPVVKIIDFGVAKALHQDLTDKTLFTQFSHLIGTPLYMSPEQAGHSSLDIDTRSDIYSLAVLLYELLTGTTPFERDLLSAVGLDGARKIIREQDPPRPSVRLTTLAAAQDSTMREIRPGDRKRLAIQLRRELDWIVMKGLEKDRQRRYQTALDLAKDVDCYLRNEPIRAKPSTFLRRLGKWSRRHRPLVSTIGIVSIALAVLIAANVWSQYQEQLRVKQFVSETLATAQAFLQSEKYELALQELDKAHLQLEEAGIDRDTSIEKVIQLTGEVKQKLTAQQQFNQFQKLRHRALQLFGGYVSTEEEQLLKESLEIYQMFDDIELEELPIFQELDTHVQKQLREDLAEQLFLQARAYFNQANYHRAIDVLSTIESVFQPTRSALKQKSQCWRILGEDAIAARMEVRAQEVKPETAIDYFMLSAGWNQPGPGNLHDLDNYYLALDLNPVHIQSLAATAWTYQWLNQFSESEAMSTAYIAVQPNASWGYLLRSRARFAQHKVEPAERDLERALKIESAARGRAVTMQGTFMERKRKYAEALAIYDSMLLRDKYAAWTRTVRANLYHTLGDYQKAIHDLDIMIESHPKSLPNPKAGMQTRSLVYWLVDRAFVYADAGKPKLAHKDITTALSVECSFTGTERYLAWFFATCPDPTLRNPKQALTLALGVIAREERVGNLKTPVGAEYWLTLGVAQYRSEDFSSALKSFEKAAHFDRYDLNLVAYGFFAAMSHWQLGNEDLARDWYNRTLKARNWQYNDIWHRHVGDWQISGFRKEAAKLLGYAIVEQAD